MERRVNNKVNAFQKGFKDSIVEKLNNHFKEETNNSNLNELIKYIYDYPYIELTQEDFVKRKRIKNSVPLYERCMALKSNGKQCTRRKKDGCDFCGTHIKGTQNGIVSNSSDSQKEKKRKLEITTMEIQGIEYFIDDIGNVYNTYDIHQNKNNPKIVAKYIIDDNGTYKIPSIFDK